MTTGYSTVIPGFRYRNAPAAIDWLCQVFGFERHAVYANPDGTIAHAELTLGGGMVMLGSLTDSPYQRLLRHPDEISGRPAHGTFVLVPDADAVYARAKAAGATILIEIKDESYGGRDFTCSDPEGYVWSAGTYNPWK